MKIKLLVLSSVLTLATALQASAAPKNCPKSFELNNSGPQCTCHSMTIKCPVGGELLYRGKSGIAVKGHKITTKKGVSITCPNKSWGIKKVDKQIGIRCQ